MRRHGLLIRIVYALCLAGASINHLRALLTHGWLPDHLPTATALYWSSLAFLDPITALLLFLRPRAGIGLTVAIMISDVAHNLWFIAFHPLRGSFVQDVASSGFMISQIVFLVFVAATAPVAWQASKPQGQFG
jgi:hypothetical protein